MDQLDPLQAQQPRQATVDEDLDRLPHHRARPAPLTDFVDELSNWYVRRGRERFWGKRHGRGQGSRLRDPVHTCW